MILRVNISLRYKVNTSNYHLYKIIMSWGKLKFHSLIIRILSVITSIVNISWIQLQSKFRNIWGDSLSGRDLRNLSKSTSFSRKLKKEFLWRILYQPWKTPSWKSKISRLLCWRIMWITVLQRFRKCLKVITLDTL